MIPSFSPFNEPEREKAEHVCICAISLGVALPKNASATSVEGTLSQLRLWSTRLLGQGIWVAAYAEVAESKGPKHERHGWHGWHVSQRVQQ